MISESQTWTRYKDARPTEAGLYEWRVPSKAVPGAVLIVAAEMRWRGAGYENVLSPEFDYWDGYRVHVQCDVEWRETGFTPERNQRTPHILSIEGLDISPCSHCGHIPIIEAHQSDSRGTAICPDPWNLNSWRLVCCRWGTTPRMSDPREAERIRRETRCRSDAQAAEIEQLKEALNLALEYWSDRQQRYKNRSPVWVQKARAALSGETA